MEKRLLAAIILTFAFLFFYTKLAQPPEERPDKPAATAVREESLRAPQKAEIPREFDTPAPPAAPSSAKEKEVIVETHLYRAVFSSTGAKLQSFRLKNYHERWRPVDEIEREMSSITNRISKLTSEILKLRTRMRSEENEEKLFQLKTREQEIREEQKSLEITLERLTHLKKQTLERRQKIKELSEQLAYADNPELVKEIERQITIENGVELIPPGASPPSIAFPSINVDMDLIRFKPDKEYLKVTEDLKAVRFSSPSVNGVEISKTFTFSNNDYTIGLDFSVINRSGKEINEQNMRISYFPGVGLEESAPARGVITGIVSFIDGALHTDKISAGRSSIAPETPKLRAGKNVWTAIKGKYFTVALIPEFQHCVLSAGVLPGEGKIISVAHPEIILAEGDTFSSKITIYLGPQSTEELSKAAKSLTGIIDYGFWSPVAKIIDYLLTGFDNIFNNFGIAIIMLSLTVKIAFYPLTHKSFIAMKKMQDDMKAIQPKIDELKKKYGNNQQKMNKAMMELYKKEGVNPMSGCKGGCFPMLLQMPVFFALYAVLNTSIELRGANFMGWITDLSLPDPLRILPILMGVSMFWQQKQTGSGAAGPQQDQAKMMQWMMPVMLTFIFFGLPAGIVLYWFSFNIFTSIQQMIIKRHGA